MSTPRKRTAASELRLAALRHQDQQRRRKQLGLGGGTAVVVIVVALIIARVASGGGGSSAPAAARADGTGVAQQLATVPAASLNPNPATAAATVPLTGQPPLTAAGKPRVVYLGAEYCPYCAAERWPLVQALSRFGTFTDLGLTASSPRDVHPSTPTLSFHGASYTSPYLSFTGIESESNVATADGGYQPLDAVPSDVQALATKYDAVPYVSPQAAGSIPFADLGGKALISGAAYDPDVLKGLTQSQIAADLRDPGSAVAKAVLPAANSITKTLCTLTGGTPAAVCTASGVASSA